MDPACENPKLAKRAGNSEWAAFQPLDFKFTSRDTPKHNSLAELAFPYLTGKARAMMGAARVPEDIESKVALEAIACTTKLDGLIVVDVKCKMVTRDVHMFGANPSWSSRLKIWGEAGVVAEGKDSKTGDQGASMMFVGYADCKSDSVRMWDMQTSRDVIWLKLMFFNDDAAGVIDLDTLEDLEAELGAELGAESGIGLSTKNEDDITAMGPNNNQPDKLGGTVRWGRPLVTGPSTMLTRAGRAIKPPDRLTYAPAVELRYLGEMAELDHCEIANTYMALQSMDIALIGAGIGGGISHTSQLKVMNYKKDMRSPDAKEWHKEIKNEKAQFDKYNALTAVPRDLLPKGAKVLTTTWAMKQMSNRTQRGRLNACGYEQVDGSHYASDSIAAPVTNPITVRIVLMLYCMNHTWMSAIIDIEGAFLQGQFVNKEELYIEVPDRFQEWYQVT